MKFRTILLVFICVLGNKLGAQSNRVKVNGFAALKGGFGISYERKIKDSYAIELGFMVTESVIDSFRVSSTLPNWDGDYQRSKVFVVVKKYFRIAENHDITLGPLLCLNKNYVNDEEIDYFENLGREINSTVGYGFSVGYNFQIDTKFSVGADVFYDLEDSTESNNRLNIFLGYSF